MKIWIHAVTATYEFIELPKFLKQFKRLKLNKADLEELKQALIDEEPEADLGANVYKFRWAPSRWNKGQSGAIRVIYVDVIKDSKAYLVSIYAKNNKDNLTIKEKDAIKQLGKLFSKGDNNMSQMYEDLLEGFREIGKLENNQQLFEKANEFLNVLHERKDNSKHMIQSAEAVPDDHN